MFCNATHDIINSTYNNADIKVVLIGGFTLIHRSHSVIEGAQFMSVLL